MARNAKKALRSETILSIALILLVTLLTYGVLIPRLGFYRDDWYMLWTGQAQGPAGLINLFKIDRPFEGWLYALEYPLLGQARLGWQIYGLLLRFLAALAFFWLLRIIWPEKRLETTFTTLLFVVYPGYYQQPDATTFNSLLLAIAASIFSITLTIKAVRAQKLYARLGLTALSILFGLLYLAIYEAMIGMEAVRLMLLWYILHQEERGKLKASLLRTLKYALPYLALGFAFAFWRLFIFQGERRAINLDVLMSEYSASPLHSLLSILIEIPRNIINTLFFAWAVPIYQFTSGGRLRDLGGSLLLALLIAGLALAFYFWAKRRQWIKDNNTAPSRHFLHLMVLGIAIVTVTIIPIVVAGRTVIFGIQWDRYTAQSMFGVAMVMGGLAFYALRTPARWVFLFSLIAIGVITQFYSAVYYRDFWTQEREVWWQLAWRAPDFKPDTTVIAAFPHGYRLAEEYEVWSPLNIIYNPGGPIKVSGQIPFDGIALDLASGTQETRHMRSILVPRDYGKALILSKPTENSCAHLINGKQLELPSNEDPAIASIAVYSQIDLVDTSAAPKTPPAELFGPEPDHTWCYYYQKIDLARQMEDWGDAAHLADQAASLDLKPADRSEWLPALEAYVNAGEPDKARQVAKYIRADKSLRTVLCDQIEGTQEWPASYDPEQIVNTLCGSGN